METIKTYFNQELYNSLEKKIGGGFSEEVGRKVVNALHSSLVEALRADHEEILPDAHMGSDLFAEDFDGLEIASLLEKSLGIKFSMDNGPLALAILYKNPNDKELVEKTVLELTEETYLMLTS